MKKTFSIAAVAIALIAGGYPIQQVETTYKSVQVGSATVEMERAGSQVSIQVEGIPEDGEISVTRGSREIEEVADGLFEDRLPENGSGGAYTFSLESPVEIDSLLVSSGKIHPANLAAYVNLNLVSTNPPETSGDSMSARASTTLPSRTRFRYQTFISEYDTPAPPLACAPVSSNTVIVTGNFLGDNRSWNPDSDSFKTRSDVVVDWAAGGTITPDFSVGETTLILDYFYPSLATSSRTVSRKTASSSGLKLVKKSMNSNFVAFNISSDVTNPFCIDWMTKGISYNFDFAVFREGTYVVDGTLLRVPNHELYSRNNANPLWKTVFRVPNQGFQCLIEVSVFCDLSKYVKGDLVP